MIQLLINDFLTIRVNLMVWSVAVVMINWNGTELLGLLVQPLGLIATTNIFIFLLKSEGIPAFNYYSIFPHKRNYIYLQKQVGGMLLLIYFLLLGRLIMFHHISLSTDTILYMITGNGLISILIFVFCSNRLQFPEISMQIITLFSIGFTYLISLSLRLFFDEVNPLLCILAVLLSTAITFIVHWYFRNSNRDIHK